MIQKGINYKSIEEALLKCRLLPYYTVMIACKDQIQFEEYKKVILSMIKEMNIDVRINNSRFYFEIKFTNSIFHLQVANRALGYRIHDLYYDKYINQEIIDNILIPSTNLSYNNEYLTQMENYYTIKENNKNLKENE